MPALYDRKLRPGALCLAVLLAALTTVLCAQQAPDPVQEAENRAKIAEAEKRLAEAERDALKARLGDLTAKTPTGSLTLSGKVEIEAHILAYRAADAAAGEIMKAVLEIGPKPTRIIFHDRELEEIRAYRAFLAQLDLLGQQLEPLKKPIQYRTQKLPRPCGPLPLAMPPPLLAASTALQVLSLFKTDTTITGVDVKLDDFGIAALLAGKLRKEGIAVVYPPVFYPGVFVGADKPDSVNKIEQLIRDRSQLQEQAAQLATKKAELLQGREKETDTACKQYYTLDIQDVDARLADIKTWSERADAIVNALLKTDADGGRREILRLARAELLLKHGQGAHILALKPVAAGGENKVKTNILGSSLHFSGGVILAYMVFAPDGALVHSGVVPKYGGYVRDKEFNKELK